MASFQQQSVLPPVVSVPPKPVLNNEFSQKLRSTAPEIRNDLKILRTYYYNRLRSIDTPRMSDANYLSILESFGIKLPESENNAYCSIIKYYMEDWPHWDEKQKWYTEYIKQETLVEPTAPQPSKTILRHIQTIYKDYCAYLKLKLECVSSWKEEWKEEWKQERKTECKNVQTYKDTSPQKPISPYHIEIKGPSKLLNSIVFTMDTDGIVVKQHVDKPWSRKHFTLRKFINSPHVAVYLNLGDLNFSRINVHEFDRYIANVNVITTVSLPRKSKSVSKIDENKDVNVYTYYYFKMYVKQLELLLKTENRIAEWRKLEIMTILDEFLKDIEEININVYTMATNTSVCFEIGDNKYIRSKQTTMRDINFCEVVTPKILLNLNSFNGQQDLRDKKKVTFITLNRFQKSVTSFIDHVNHEDTLCYGCKLCEKTYRNYTGIMEHFEAEHKGDQALICWKCRETVHVHDIAGKRWKHNC